MHEEKTLEEEAGAVRADSASDETPEDTGAGFAELGLGPKLVSTLNSLGYEEPTPIQEQAIPQLLTGVDLLSLIHI